MPQTLTERVALLERIGDVVTTRLNAAEGDIDGLVKSYAVTAQHLADLERDHDRETALLQREVADLRAWREEWKRGNEEFGRKMWLIVPPLLAAVVSSALTGFITYLLRR